MTMKQITQRKKMSVEMNKTILAMVFALVLVLTGREACFAYTAHLAWNTVVNERGVAGYKVHYQMDSDVPPFNGTGATEIEVPGQSATPNTIINGLDPAHSYSFAVTSYITVNNVKIESVYSNIVTVPVLTVSITAPDANSKVGGTVQVTATASAGTYAVDLFVNGNLQIPRLTSPPYLFAWDTSTLDHGPYSLLAKAYYSPASSIAGESATVSVTVVKAKNQGTGNYYETLQQAYDDALDGATLMLWSSERIVENILCWLANSVTIKGGYDQGFPPNNAGYTAFSGSFSIGQGTVILDRVVIF
jgi:hypothetical protein